MRFWPPSLTFPTLNLTGTDPPHISSGTGIQPAHQLAHRSRQVQTHTVHSGKHFSHRLHLFWPAWLSHLWPLFLLPLCIWERSFPNQSEPQDSRAAAVHSGGGGFPTSKHCTALMIRHSGSHRVPPECNLTLLILHVIFSCSGAKRQAPALQLLCKAGQRWGMLKGQAFIWTLRVAVGSACWVLLF